LAQATGLHDYYDGPRLGVAELNGVPHIYEAEFDHSTDEYGDTYFLSPIKPELLALLMEDWAIWCGGTKRTSMAMLRLKLIPHFQLSASLKRSANGRPRGPGRRYAVHFRQPGPGVLPSSPLSSNVRRHKRASEHVC
jgi:hypothetical protein